jgi:hypothetical protein
VGVSTPTIHDVDNYGRHSVMPGRHTVAVSLTGMTRRTITYAAQTGKLSSIKLPGRTGHYLLDLDEVRMFAAMQEDG